MLMSGSPLRVLIAGGGTGGHLFPGVAVAEEIMARHRDSEVMFVGTERGIEARVVPELGYQLELIRISGIKTVGLRGAIRGLFRIPGALRQSRKIIKKFRPDVVIGVGGYASGPVVMMARLMRLPTAILEQNSIPGLTNKILGKFARNVFLSFEESRRFFRNKKIIMSGNPIRAAIRGAMMEPKQLGAAKAKPHLFVFGGSQGAVAVNELAVGAIKLLRDRGLEFSVLHQAGKRNVEATQKLYAAAGVDDVDCVGFINDMAAEYKRADLIVSRAGATSVAELGIVGRPAILIPFPFAADNHQVTNAAELVEAGAARMHEQKDLTAEILADEIAEILTDAKLRHTMAEAMRAHGKPQAAAAVVDWCAEQAAK